MDTSFVIATYNARIACDPAPNDWESRAPRYREIVRKNHFDIFGMQEPNKKQVEDVVRGTDYAYIGVGRDDFKDAGEFSCIVYSIKRFEVVNGGTFGLSEHPEIPGYRSWGTACPRIATWGLFRDLKTGKEFIYYNTHLDHVSKDAQINGIKLLIHHAAENAAGKPLVITGDFNAVPGSETYSAASAFLQDAGLISKTPCEGPDITWHGWGKAPNACRIDYIFVSKEFIVNKFHVDDTMPGGRYASDHYPVIADVTIA